MSKSNVQSKANDAQLFSADTRESPMATRGIDDSAMDQIENAIEETYSALQSILESSQAHRTALYRPPFNFLHRILIKGLAEFGFYTSDQLSLANLSSRQDRIVFLVRALGFVSFCAPYPKSPMIPCLYATSPMNMLAGVNVLETLSFLQQIMIVRETQSRKKKLKAAQKVLEEGDARLYSIGVAFRRAIVVFQALYRGHLCRRQRNRSVRAAAESIPSMAVTRTNAIPTQSSLFYSPFLYKSSSVPSFPIALPHLEPNKIARGALTCAKRSKRETESRVACCKEPETAQSKRSHVTPDAFFGAEYQAIEPHEREQERLLYEIVHRIDAYRKRKHLRMIDLFRFCDTDGNGSISAEELIATLAQVEMFLTLAQAKELLFYIDKDGSGEIDIDEFEELLRTVKRKEFYLTQANKELSRLTRRTHSQLWLQGKESVIAIFATHRQRILDACVAFLGQDFISLSQLEMAVRQLQLENVTEKMIQIFVSHLSLRALNPNIWPERIAYSQLLEYLKESHVTISRNRFLDRHWVTQLDAHLERGYREFEFL